MTLSRIPVKVRQPRAKVYPLPLEKIRIDGGTQARVEISETTRDEYAESVGSLPPVDVFFDGSVYWLADGFHRYHAHLKAGKTKIRAKVYTGTKRDAVLHGLGANGTHGLRRSNADKRRAVEMMLNDPEWKKWSQGDIAEVCGVSREFVSRVLGELRSSGNLTCDRSQVSYTTRHGTPATMDTSKMGLTGAEQATDQEIPHPTESASDRSEREQPAKQATSSKRTSNATAGREKAEDIPTDREGAPIPKQYPWARGAFEFPVKLRSFNAKISALKSEFDQLSLEEMEATQGRGMLPGVDQGFKTDVDNLHSKIRFATAYSLCPVCGGSAECSDCHQRGVINEISWNQSFGDDVKQGLRKAAEAHAGRIEREGGSRAA